MASSTWWLCGVDGPIPAGDAVYAALVAGTAVEEYGPVVANFVATYGPAAWDKAVYQAQQINKKGGEAIDSIKGKADNALSWIKEKIGGNNSNGDPSKKPSLYKLSDKEVKRIVIDLGYKDVHEFKKYYVGKENISKYNIKVDKNTGQIFLEGVKNKVQITTGLYK